MWILRMLHFSRAAICATPVTPGKHFLEPSPATGPGALLTGFRERG
jgi:hypothetical protein